MSQFTHTICKSEQILQPPELLNRLSEVVPFSRLQRDNMRSIANIGLAEIAQRLEDGQNMTLDVSEPALVCLSEKGYDIRYGARPLKRTLARDVLHPLSRMVLEGGVLDGDEVRVRTRAEAEKLERGSSQDSDAVYLGYISGNKNSSDKNDVVIMRNHRSASSDGDLMTNNNQDQLLEVDDEQLSG